MVLVEIGWGVAVGEPAGVMVEVSVGSIGIGVLVGSAGIGVSVCGRLAGVSLRAKTSDNRWPRSRNTTSHSFGGSPVHVNVLVQVVQPSLVLVTE